MPARPPHRRTLFSCAVFCKSFIIYLLPLNGIDKAH
jgi:hypothetical protein